MNFEVAHQFISFIGRDHLPRFFHVMEHLCKNSVVIPVNVVIVVLYYACRADICGDKHKCNGDRNIKRSVFDFQDMGVNFPGRYFWPCSVVVS